MKEQKNAKLDELFEEAIENLVGQVSPYLSSIEMRVYIYMLNVCRPTAQIQFRALYEYVESTPAEVVAAIDYLIEAEVIMPLYNDETDLALENPFYGIVSQPNLDKLRERKESGE